MKENGGVPEVNENEVCLEANGNAVKIGSDVPKYGWSVKMDHQFPERWTQNLTKIRIHQIPDLLTLAIRYLIWWIRTYLFHGIKPFIDMCTLNGKQIYGVPIGGIGSGSIGRGFKGEFCRFQMSPGLYTYDVVHANQFILTVLNDKGENLYQKVLTGAKCPKGKLSSWDWSFRPQDGSYLGLFPRAWYTYSIPELDLKLICKQISPVIPHNYTDSCLPVAVFVWDIEYNGKENLKISITFTFKNGVGTKEDRKTKCVSHTFSGSVGEFTTKGVALGHTISGNDTTYGLGCLEMGNQYVSCTSHFNLKSGKDIWDQLKRTGHLESGDQSYEVEKGELGVAVCCQAPLTSKSKSTMVFSLTWDQPEIKFPGKTATFKRRYVRQIRQVDQTCVKGFSVAGVRSLIKLSFSRFKDWDEAIEQWQNPVLSDEKLPDWFKSAIFNELYFIADGGTLWFDYDPSTLPKVVTKGDDIRNDIGRFAYLEAHEYRMFNTYDVHFYSSFALTMLWPKLQLSLQYDFADSIYFEDTARRICLFDGARCIRKVKDSVPHDVGDPCEEPFVKINSYLMHDVSTWKDLNLKFVLEVFRDYKFTRDVNYLNDMIQVCNLVMKKSMEWDVDGDGMIENSGTADQTYDTWIMKGTSAYCGSLWLGALVAMVEMLKCCKDYEKKKEDLESYESTLLKGKASFHQKLWTGDYYQFDCSGRSNEKSIMSDQLCGHWYLAMCGLDDSDVFPKENVRKALTTIFNKNVCCVMNGEMGAINGIMPNGEIDTYTLQSEETWTGVSYALAATLINQGMIDEGFKTGEGIYRTVYERIGMGFETPEALIHNKRYRAIGYMRPLSIWSMLLAWNNKKKSI